MPTNDQNRSKHSKKRATTLMQRQQRQQIDRRTCIRRKSRHQKLHDWYIRLCDAAVNRINKEKITKEAKTAKKISTTLIKKSTCKSYERKTLYPQDFLFNDIVRFILSLNDTYLTPFALLFDVWCCFCCFCCRCCCCVRIVDLRIDATLARYGQMSHIRHH